MRPAAFAQQARIPSRRDRLSVHAGDYCRSALCGDTRIHIVREKLYPHNSSHPDSHDASTRSRNFVSR
jgi:hypothetical protein